MGREVRMVPKDFEHPEDKEGEYIPLLTLSITQAQKDWDVGNEKWKEGFVSNFKGGWVLSEYCVSETFEEYTGRRPIPEEHMPDFPEDTATHFRMYETCTEGTPISPAFETPEELAKWLSDNGASSFGSRTATYEQWLTMIKEGSVCSAIMDADGIRSGVEAISDKEKKAMNKCTECKHSKETHNTGYTQKETVLHCMRPELETPFGRNRNCFEIRDAYKLAARSRKNIPLVKHLVYDDCPYHEERT